MAKQLLLLVAVTLGTGPEAETKPPGSIVVVDDAIADDLLGSEPPAARLDASELPAAAPKPRRGGKPAAPPPPPPAGGEGAGAGAGEGEGGSPGGDGAAGEAGDGAPQP